MTLQGVSAGPADLNDPLAGPAANPAPIEGIPAAFVPPGSGLGFSATVQTLFKDAEQIALIADDGINDFTTAKFLIDGNKTWKVTNIEHLKPANIGQLYVIGVRSP